ncbi:cytochrome P450 [Lyngbya aestuarii]|uniref:cytochrome P450 n=1 Tax=Lyngbya aestuarii TaxID=118322 RepID=UPI00403DAE2C
MDSKKILQAHKIQLQVSWLIDKVGYDSPLGKSIRFITYLMDGLLVLNAWRDFLVVRQQQIGNKFLAVDQAIIHSSYSGVRKLMQTEPQWRGNDLGIIRIYAPSYLLDNPLSLGTNGAEHTGVRAVLEYALPEPLERTEVIGRLVDQLLFNAAQRGRLHIGEDLPRMIIAILHQLIFQITLSEQEISASLDYTKNLFFASLPEPILKTLLKGKIQPQIEHRQRLIAKYKQSPQWQSYREIGTQYRLNEHQIVNSIFDMIHIAGTAGTSALLGSVIGVLCLEETVRNNVVSEVNSLWNGEVTPNAGAIENSELIGKVILETARLYPPVRFVSQLAPEAGEVEIGGKQCPFQKGTRLLGSVFTANRDQNKYQRPDSFDVTRDNSDILSWNGEGHERACPGRSLSIGLIKMFCFYLFKKYQWNSFSEVKWDMEKVRAVTPNDLVLSGFSQRSV